MGDYDLFVIGGGPGGYHAAELAAKSGLTVALAEKNQLGGVCLNEGCIPSKLFLKAAKVHEGIKTCNSYGVYISGPCVPTIEHAAVLQRKERVLDSLRKGIKMQLASAKVTVINRGAYIAGKKDGLFQIQVDEELYKAKNLLIATGSSVCIPPVQGIQQGMDSGFVLTNREILALDRVPKRLIVIGAGAVGLEMAAYYSAAGASVTVIEMLSSIGGSLDREIASLLQRSLEKMGVTFFLNTCAKKIGKNLVCIQKDEEEIVLSADKVLLSTGRRANLSGFGIETTGVRTDHRGIMVDDHCCTNVQGIYAAGDVTGKVMLAHVAYRQGEVAVNHILGRQDEMEWNAVPSIIYTEPEAASIGLTMAAAKQAGIPALERKIPMAYSGRFVAEHEFSEGLCKLVFSKDQKKLLGLHLVGSYASEIIWGAAYLIGREVPVSELKKLIFPHPTVCELIKDGILKCKDE